MTKNHDETAHVDKVVIAKDNYSLTILQGPMGGGGCTFPDDTNPQALSINLSTATDIPTLNGLSFRRGESWSSATSKTYAVCEKTPDGQRYSTFTDFGIINYTTPLNADAQVLGQMDAMVGSLKKQ